MNESLSRNFILVLCGTSVLFLLVIIPFVQDQIKLQTEIIESERLITVTQIASRTELRIDDAVNILKILSKHPHITNPPSAIFIDDKLHGISENVDVDRRDAMQDVFDEYGNFQNMLFLLPNGDVYINEPFSFQRNMTVSNFAFRDWYKEVVDTHDVVVSDVVVSKSSGKHTIVIAVPVFSQDKSIQGILTGSLNLDIIQKRLEDMKSYTDERIILVDSKRTVISDSEGILKGQSLTLGVGAIKNALLDKSGTVIGTVNGTKMFVVYSPIKVADQSTWAIISTQPYDQAFSSIHKTIQETLILMTFIIIIISISVFTVNRLFQTQFKLRKQSEETNASLIKTQKNLEEATNTIREQLDKLKDVEKLKDEFASMVSHELKTPLFPIKFHAKMLMDPDFGALTDKQKESINQIYHSSKQLEKLIGDLLDVQRLELGTMKFKYSEIESDKIMNDIHYENSVYMTEKNISFTNTTDEKIIFKSDHDRIKQVFVNLIKNSVDFVPEKIGKIEIGAKRDGDKILFYVKDNGIGIPKEKQKNLFKKFYQIDTSVTRKHGGTGLGLSICKGIVEGLGGEIWVGDTIEKGTMMCFNLPIHTFSNNLKS